MARGAWFWIVVAVGLLVVLGCAGGWTPLSVQVAAGSTHAGLKFALWGISSVLGLVVGPTILLWVFLCGPPDRKSGSGVAGTMLLLLLGVVLTITALLKLPLIAGCLALLFLVA